MFAIKASDYTTLILSPAFKGLTLWSWMESYNVLKKERKENQKVLFPFSGRSGERDLLVIAELVFVPHWGDGLNSAQSLLWRGLCWIQCALPPGWEFEVVREGNENRGEGVNRFRVSMWLRNWWCQAIWGKWDFRGRVGEEKIWGWVAIEMGNCRVELPFQL